ncbi:MAG: hypothetical protein P9L98_04720 [Candidatus Kaelpia imicola]|nr:hypothetical protein [Candidatus Kaelpia imicola]
MNKVNIAITTMLIFLLLSCTANARRIKTPLSLPLAAFFQSDNFILEQWDNLDQGISFEVGGDYSIISAEIKRVGSWIIFNIVGLSAEELTFEIQDFIAENLESSLLERQTSVVVIPTVTSRNLLMEDRASIFSLSLKELSMIINDLNNEGDGSGFLLLKPEKRNVLHDLAIFLDEELTLISNRSEREEILSALSSSKENLLGILKEMYDRYQDVDLSSEYISVGHIAMPNERIDRKIECIREAIYLLKTDISNLIYRIFYFRYMQRRFRITDSGTIIWNGQTSSGSLN